jgi:N-acetyl-alpha-D-muramate 1-phosphate uridylyltransferase
VRSRDGFGVDVVFSHEEDRPLDTAGGLRHARHLFRGDAPFFLHNCDVFSTIDLDALYRAHSDVTDETLVTLAVLPPSAERFLIFDRRGLCGFAPRGGGEPVHVRDPEGREVKRDFSGIHVASPALLDTLDDGAAPNIVSHYLHMVRGGKRIGRYDQGDARWIDIGTHEKLARARDLYSTL